MITKDDVIIERLERLEREVKKIALLRECEKKQIDELVTAITKGLLKVLSRLDVLIEYESQIAENTAYSKSFDSAICNIQYQLNSVLALLQDSMSTSEQLEVDKNATTTRNN